MNLKSNIMSLSGVSTNSHLSLAQVQAIITLKLYFNTKLLLYLNDKDSLPSFAFLSTACYF